MNSFKLDGIFTEHMILQRDTEVVFFGNTNGDSNIRLEFEGKTYPASINADRFEIRIPAHEKGTDFVLNFISDNSSKTINDVCFGDVFILAGQSNMELPVNRTLDISLDEVNEADYPLIRQYRLMPNYRLDPNTLAELPEAEWVKAVPGEIMEMSALGFYAAKRIQKEVDAPIGLILSAQGGSSLESWCSREDVLKYEDLSELIDSFIEDGSVQKYLDDAQVKECAWREALETNNDDKVSSFIPQEARTVVQPGMIDGILGCVWLYKEITLDEVTDEMGFLYLSNMIDVDRTYVNGNFVGRTEYRYPPRQYKFDSKFLKKGTNLIAVRLLVQHGKGGIVPEHSFYMEQGSNRIELSGEWKMWVETTSKIEADTPLMGQTIPTSLYQSSVVPLKNFKFKGMWWYQGETNAERPLNYLNQYKDMVTRWRKLVGYEFPVVLVEMPDYIDPINGFDENWTLIQEAQHKTPEVLTNSITCYGRDLGEPQEIHPQRKSELGIRFAKCVLELIYNK